MTPASRLLFWIRAAFLGDLVIAILGAYLLATGDEGAGIGCLVFALVRAVIGVAALLIASAALSDRHPNDDRPSSIFH